MSGLIVRHAQAKEMAALGDLVAGCLASADPKRSHNWQQRYTDPRTLMPDFDPSLCRVVMVDDRCVAHVLIQPYELRYGGALLRVAGMRNICTHPDRQQQGYSAALMHDALTYMAEQGVHLALLEGSGKDYARFGFSPVWPDYFFAVESAEAARLDQPLPLRQIHPDDIPYLSHLYERHWGGRTAFVRNPETWLWRMKHETERQIHVVEDRQRAICGYLAAADLPDERAEVIADTPEAASTLLAVFGARYLAAGIDRIRWSVPPDDLLVAYARQLLTVTVSARYQPNDGWLARLIDTQALVETLTPEIVAQARTTDPRFDPAALVFDCQPDVVQIGLQQRPNTVSRLGHRDFIQIMFGSLRPAALTTLHADAVHLLDTLFPPRMAAIAPWDWF